MIRLCVLTVFKGHIHFLANSNNLQNVKTKKEIWHENLPSIKYAPYTNKRTGNQKMVIKVRHTYCQLHACTYRVHSDFMEIIYCKKYQWGPKIRN